MQTHDSVTQTGDAEEIEETAYYIAGHLAETEQKTIKQIRRVVKVLGPDVALDYLKQTRAIEKAGGMLIASGKRRRTPGGVFFYLVQTHCDADTVALIWPTMRKEAGQ
jgi:PHAX RNA-binding domain